ncbi:MAG: HPr family phosphocarrier protein [Desulfobacteraceae bacterium]|jgi:phosphocarrier protein
MPLISEPLWRDVTIVNELGLHARSAAKLAKLAQQAAGAVWLQAGSERIDAKQILDILTLAAARGDRVQIGIETPADLAVLDLIEALFADGFGE